MLENALLERIRAEFLEMPGLRVTVEQAQCLWGVERALCQQVLDALVEANFLCVTRNGAYARLAGAAIGPEQRRDMRSVHFSSAELKALQDVFETAESVDWAAYERARTRIRQARLVDTPRPQPAKANLRTARRFEKTAGG